MTEAERGLLAREARRPDFRQLAIEQLEIGVLAPLVERELELELPVEMVLDNSFIAAGDEDEMLDSGFARLVHHVLDDRPVDHREHLLRHRLGGGQEPGAEAGNREHSLADRRHGRKILN